MLNPYKENIAKLRITSPYGMRGSEFHKGIDIVSDGDKTIVAIGNGVIGASTIVMDKSNLTWQWGNYVRLDLDSGEHVYYCHMSKRLANVGQRVKTGDAVGIEGTTGYSSGSHLHLEIRPKSGSSDATNAATFIGCKNETGALAALPDGTGGMVESNSAIGDVSDWAKEAQAWAKANGISDGAMPQANVTREQMWTMLQCFYEKFVNAR